VKDDLIGTIGLWRAFNGMEALAGRTIPPGLAWATLVAEASVLLCIIGYWQGGEQHPLAAAGYVLGLLSETV
jgi:hypothetical protein